MDNQIIEAIRLLADKLEKPAQDLWAVLMKQAYVTGGLTLFFSCLWLIAVVSLLYKVVTFKFETFYDSDRLMVKAVAALASMLALLVITAGIQTGLEILLNPEFWALRKLIGK